MPPNTSNDSLKEISIIKGANIRLFSQKNKGISIDAHTIPCVEVACKPKERMLITSLPSFKMCPVGRSVIKQIKSTV